MSDRFRLSRRQFGRGLGAALSTACAGRGWAQGQPARIVSTAPSATETLFALGLGPRVVGVSIYCEYPPQVKALPKVGTYVQPDVEAIARLRPDLVVLQRHPGALTGRLDALGIQYVEMPYGMLADVYTGIELVARATGVAAKGAALDGEIRQQLAAMQARSAGRPKPRVLVIVDRRPGLLTDLIAVGPSSYVNEMISIAGGVNVISQAGLPMYPRIAFETVLREQPEVIVDLTDAHDANPAHDRVRAGDLQLWAQHPELAAVRSGRVRIGRDAVLLVPGPRSPQAAEMLFDYFHGGAA